MIRPKASRLALLFLPVLALILFAACSDNEDESTAPAAATATTPAYSITWPADDWETSEPETEGMDGDRLDGVADYCDEHGCRAVVIVRHGRIVWERYWDGWDKDSTDNSWSMAKSITSALVGIAIAEGKIEGLGQPAVDFIPEWRGTDREKITLGHLLSMSSGLSWSMIYDPPTGDTINMLRSDDAAGYAISRPLYREPGSDWYYSDGDAQSWARILEAATGMNAAAYAEEALFGPIGIESADWKTDTLGQPLTFCCVFATARDFARFGYLFLRDGKWGDEQVVPESWVEASVRPSQMENPNYGLYWWLWDFPGVPEDAFMAMGFQTKRIYVIPSLDIVAVRLGEGDDEGWSDADFLRPIVEAAASG
ncbi:MAG: serine hydrolase [Dehalococcoidia bacterium]|nr:serine hydrolase [Dehalococcoidia bacterium]